MEGEEHSKKRSRLNHDRKLRTHMTHPRCDPPGRRHAEAARPVSTRQKLTSTTISGRTQWTRLTTSGDPNRLPWGGRLVQPHFVSSQARWPCHIPPNPVLDHLVPVRPPQTDFSPLVVQPPH